MDFDLSEDQAVLLAAVDNIAAKYNEISANARVAFHVYAKELDSELSSGGFFEAAKTTDIGAIGAALLVERISRLPQVVEIGASALVVPHLHSVLPRPCAIITRPLDQAHRFLPQAATALIDLGDDVVAYEVKPENVEVVESIYAYPYGRFRAVPNLNEGVRLGSKAVKPLRQWSHVALAAEIAGAMRAALDFTVQYAKDRRMFGRQLASYQAVQHRLAECDQIARATYWLAMAAAWSGEALDASLAACYAQSHVQKLIFDLHQFNGAMGLTTEHLLHFWTFRIRALQAESGGANGAASKIAENLWGSAQ